MDLQQYIRTVPDFPKPGILFYDITTLLKDSRAFDESIRLLAGEAAGLNITAVAAVESRGFIFGACVAQKLGVGFIPLRKPGKLPAETISESYSLEYGTDTIEMHKDALGKGDRVFLIDDLLATGGTISAAARLIEKTGATVSKIAFVIELGFLNGREKIYGYDIFTIMTF